MTKREKEHFMKEAILEGRKALPNCLPNPPVGCVIVRNKEIVASGYTQEPGKHHAEAMAMEVLSADHRDDLSMFVTLEPCSFHGKTPSCALAIIDKSIKQVFVGMLDPHPKNQGAGIRLLKNANIWVEVGILRDLVNADLKDYLNNG